jgi:hypothetical protein
MRKPSSKATNARCEFCKLTAIVRVISNAERVNTRHGAQCVRRWACRHQGAGRPAWSFTLITCANPALMEALAALETGDLIKVHGNLRYFETTTEHGARTAGHELFLESLAEVETVTISLKTLAPAIVDTASSAEGFDPPADWSPIDAATVSS